MFKNLLILTTIAIALGGAKAQSLQYDAVDNFFMANPDLANRTQYAGHLVNPNYILISWNQQDEIDQRMISNGFVRLGVSSWEYSHPTPYEGAGVPQRDLAISYARAIGADVVIYATKVQDDDKVDHNVWFYAKQGSEVRRAAPSNTDIPSNATASAAMNRLQDFNHRSHVKGGVWYDAATDTFNWIGPKFGRRMSEPRAQFLTEVGMAQCGK
jgi:hypothetical protein